MPAPALQRHQLVWLAAAAWQRILAADPAPAPLDCLQHWAQHDLPLVVTRQAATWSGRPDETLLLGLAAPLRWGRGRWFIDALGSDVRRHGHFPLAGDITDLVDPPVRPAWTALCADLAAIGSVARVYGSHGWQQLLSLPCLRSGSDIDLLVAVNSLAQADAVTTRLSQMPANAPRLDGELQFANGTAVAWREWAAWRAGGVKQLLVKGIHGAKLERDFMGAAFA